MYQPASSLEIQKGIYKTAIEGLLYIKRDLYEDERGFFSEICRVPEIEAVTGSPFVVKQVNHARSEQHVVRGIHAEGWNKLVSVISGRCFCAIADVRRDSSTFRQVETVVLGFGQDAIHGSLYLPSGVGNSFAVLDGPLEYVYVVDRLYADRDTAGDLAISLFDPDLHIAWPIAKEEMILSERDKNCVTLKEKFGL